MWNLIQLHNEVVSGDKISCLFTAAREISRFLLSAKIAWRKRAWKVQRIGDTMYHETYFICDMRIP